MSASKLILLNVTPARMARKALILLATWTALNMFLGCSTVDTRDARRAFVLNAMFKDTITQLRGLKQLVDTSAVFVCSARTAAGSCGPLVLSNGIDSCITRLALSFASDNAERKSLLRTYIERCKTNDAVVQGCLSQLLPNLRRYIVVYDTYEDEQIVRAALIPLLVEDGRMKIDGHITLLAVAWWDDSGVLCNYYVSNLIKD